MSPSSFGGIAPVPPPQLRACIVFSLGMHGKSVLQRHLHSMLSPLIHNEHSIMDTFSFPFEFINLDTSDKFMASFDVNSLPTKCIMKFCFLTERWLII